jgi:hypothetical protein
MNKPIVKNIAIVFAAIVVVTALGYLDHRLTPAGSWQCENGAWRRIGNPKGLPPETGCPSTMAPAAPDCDVVITKDAKADASYLKTGRLGRYETCMEDDTWYLKYETPAGQRLLKIAFADDAACAVDGVKADCTKMNPPSGSKTAMNGVPEGAVLRVGKLDFLTK